MKIQPTDYENMIIRSLAAISSHGLPIKRKPLFGEIVGETLKLSPIGKIIEQEGVKNRGIATRYHSR